MEKTFEEERMDEFEVSSILKCYKLIYIEKLTYGENEDALKALDGDLIYKELLKAHDEGRICLDITNFEAINFINEKLSEIQERSISAIYDREFSNLGWFKELVCNGLNPTDTLRETITNYSKFGTFNEEQLSGNRINEEEHTTMAINALKIYNLTKKKK